MCIIYFLFYILAYNQQNGNVSLEKKIYIITKSFYHTFLYCYCILILFLL
jgi:hypothetical protein